MLCRGSGPIQSRCAGPGVWEWHCTTCQGFFPAVAIDAEGAGVLPDHAPDHPRWYGAAPKPEPPPEVTPDPEPAPEPEPPGKKSKRPIDY